MPRDYIAQLPNRVRHADCEISDVGWIRDFLHRTPMAASDGECGVQAFINSNLFASS